MNNYNKYSNVILRKGNTFNLKQKKKCIYFTAVTRIFFKLPQ